MKLLYFGESPCVTTGIAQVSRTILDAIHKDVEIEVIGMNHFLSDYDHIRYPYTIHPCIDMEVAKDRILNAEYDIFMYSCDVGFNSIFDWRREARSKRPFITICYCPVDCDTISSETFECLLEADVVVTYTEHAKSVIEKYRPELIGKISVIYLACEPDVYYPLTAKEKHQARKELFDIGDDKFLFINVNRNQHRKDLGRTLMIFHEFYKKYPDSMLYMHCKQADIGGHLPAMAHSLGMELGKEIKFTSDSFNVTAGYPLSIMNKIYNAADCLISTSTGEGWGLTTTEAMAAGCPVIVPRNTAFVEIVGENEERGALIDTGGDIDHQIFLYGMANYPRDMVHADSMISKMEEVYFGSYYSHLLRTQQARDWTMLYTKESIGEKWKSLFQCLKENTLIEEVTV